MVIPQDLIPRCLRQERKAQKELYTVMYNYLNSIASRYANNSTEAQDILQNTFVRIFSSLERYDETLGMFKSWSCKICINEALNLKRSKRTLIYVDKLPDTDSFVTENQIDDQITLEELSQIIQKMRESERTILMMYFYDELSHKEISEILEIQETTSRARLSRARNELVSQWKLIHG